MQLVVKRCGSIRCVYAEAIDLRRFGSMTISRGSHVEPDDEGYWVADLEPVCGPRLGPFRSRSDALKAEQDWLCKNWLIRSSTP